MRPAIPLSWHLAQLSTNETERNKQNKQFKATQIMITFDELKQAAKVFDRINGIRNYVTKDRFAMAAQTRFGIVSFGNKFTEVNHGKKEE